MVFFHYSLFVTKQSENDSKNAKFKTGRFDIRDELQNMESTDTAALNEELHTGRPLLPKELSFLAPTLDREMKDVTKKKDAESTPKRTEEANESGSSKPISDVLVFTCGPESLTQSSQEFAFKIGASFHSETFFL